MINLYSNTYFYKSNQFDVNDLIGELCESTINVNESEIYSLIELYNPPVHNKNGIPYYYVLETAIKVGNLEFVKRIFERYQLTTPNYIEEMRSREKSEVHYRPIFWLAGVCNTRFVNGRPDPIRYVEIIDFMEEKLQIKPDHIHITPYGNITKIKYIEKHANIKSISDAKDLEKRQFILNHYAPIDEK
ncbi:MAG: hypothetical protein H0U27_06940 [Nitrosopumilus sp.]|nr:hypothetical protein [Nitrosopumilus sp.]